MPVTLLFSCTDFNNILCHIKFKILFKIIFFTIIKYLYICISFDYHCLNLRTLNGVEALIASHTGNEWI